MDIFELHCLIRNFSILNDRNWQNKYFDAKTCYIKKVHKKLQSLKEEVEISMLESKVPVDNILKD